MTRTTGLQAFTLILILTAGIFFRMHRTVSFTKPVGDENIYRAYVELTEKTGVSHYRRVVHEFEKFQQQMDEPLVSPLRVFYIFASYFYKQAARCDSFTAMRTVTAVFSVMHLLVACVFAWRAGGRGAMLAVGAMMAFDPLQIWLSQRALLDGVYAFWATACFWLLWENLRAPDRRAWLAAYCAALFLMVLTKENAAFVVFALCGLIVTNRWLGFGTVTPGLLVLTVLGPAAAVAVLVFYAGGITPFVNFYATFVRKSGTLEYAILCQDGPWTKYLFDFLMLTPLVTLLAVGRVFRLKGASRTDVYCAVFLALAYLSMASVKYGMSMRFAGFWGLPLCWLAWSQMRALVRRLPPERRAVVLAGATAVVSLSALDFYYRVFVFTPAYEPLTRNVLRALEIYK